MLVQGPHQQLPGNPSGFTVILDATGKVISAPGGTEPIYEDGKLIPLQRKEPVFDHGHDVCVLENGDRIVCQWNAVQTYSIKLERLALPSLISPHRKGGLQLPSVAPKAQFFA